MKISLTSVPVHDPMKAHQFYTEVLGFVSRVFMPEAYLAIVASPEEPNSTALLLEPNISPLYKTFQEGVYSAGMPIIIFGVDDIHKEFERMKKLDVKFTQEPTKGDMGFEAVFDDTCGNYIQLFQATMPS